MKRVWLAVLFLTLLAFGLRVFRLDAVSLRGDEAFTVVFVQRTWDGLWKGIRLIEPNPPLMYLVLRAWVALAGAGEFASRYFSAFFGVLCVPLIYRLGRELFAGRRATTIAVAAAGLMAINPYQIWHSQDVRNYTMWPALAMLALILMWKWLKAETGQPSGTAPDGGRAARLALIGYCLATTASLYTHYYDTFILVAENIFVFALAGLGRRWGTLARWIVAQVVLAAVYLPWVLFGTNRITTYGEASAQQSVPLLDQFGRTLATFVLGDTVPEALKSALWLPLALAVAAILIYYARRERLTIAFLVLAIAIPTLALYAISIGRPLFLERYLNGIAPAYYLVFAAGIGVLWDWAFGRRRSLANERVTSARRLTPWVLRAAPIVLCVVFIFWTSAAALSAYYFDPAYAKAPDWRGLMQFINARQQPGDIIVQNFNEMAATYYRSSTTPVVTLPKDYWQTNDDEATLQQLNRDYARIWFIPAPPDAWDPTHFVERYFTRHDDLLTDQSVSTLRAQLYATPRTFESQIRPVNARVGQAILVGYRLEASQVKRGGSLRLALHWRPVQQIQQDLHVFVHVTAPDGFVVAQQDGVPAGGTWSTRDWIPGESIVDTYTVSVDAAPGTYSLVAGMYDPTTLARVPVVDANGVPQTEDRIVLTQVTVVP